MYLRQWRGRHLPNLFRDGENGDKQTLILTQVITPQRNSKSFLRCAPQIFTQHNQEPKATEKER